MKSKFWNQIKLATTKNICEWATVYVVYLRLYYSHIFDNWEAMHMHKKIHRMAKFKHHRARARNRMMTIWNVLLICYFIEIANNVALSIIAQNIEDNMGNKIYTWIYGVVHTHTCTHMHARTHRQTVICLRTHSMSCVFCCCCFFFPFSIYYAV